MRQGTELSSNSQFMNLNFKTNTFRLVLILVASGPLFLSAQTDEPNPGKPAGKPNVKAWQKNRDEGQKAMAQGKGAEAEAFLQAALGEAEKFDAKDYRLAESLSDLGNLRLAAGDF